MRPTTERCSAGLLVMLYATTRPLACSGVTAGIPSSVNAPAKNTSASSMVMLPGPLNAHA